MLHLFQIRHKNNAFLHLAYNFNQKESDKRDRFEYRSIDQSIGRSINLLVRPSNRNLIGHAAYIGCLLQMSSYQRVDRPT
jgi:hypothetical protein